MLFFIHCTDKPGRGTLRAATRPAHLDYLKTFETQIVLVGPTQSDDGEAMTGSVLVMEFEDRAAAEAFTANDPYARAGLFESVIVRRFKKVLPKD